LSALKARRDHLKITPSLERLLSGAHFSAVKDGIGRSEPVTTTLATVDQDYDL
jgi:hypothetical protein